MPRVAFNLEFILGSLIQAEVSEPRPVKAGSSSECQKLKSYSVNRTHFFLHFLKLMRQLNVVRIARSKSLSQARYPPSVKNQRILVLLSIFQYPCQPGTALQREGVR